MSQGSTSSRYYGPILPDLTAWDELTLWSARFGTLLLDNLPLSPGLTVLDVGTAAGFPGLELAQILGPGSRVVGIDLWKEALERAEYKRRRWGVDHARFCAADGAAIPFADGTFDRLVSNVGINNFKDPAAVLEEGFRVLRPGGCLAFTTNLEGHMKEFYAEFRLVLEETGRPEYRERLRANEGHRGTKHSVRALVETAGFTVTREVESSFSMRFAGGTALLRHQLTRLGFLAAWEACLDEPDRGRVFDTLEQRLDDRAAADGEFRTSVPMLYVEAKKRPATN